MIRMATIPQNNGVSVQRLRHVDDALVGGTTEEKGNIRKLFDIRPIDEHVDFMKEAACAFVLLLLLEGIPGITPHGFSNSVSKARKESGTLDIIGGRGLSP